MDVSELRKRILRALDEARREASERRATVDQAEQDYRAFLDRIATPLVRQAAGVLKAEKQPFSVNTPAGSVRLVSDHDPETFLEFDLDRSGREPKVLGRVSVAHGRQGRVLDERPLDPARPIGALTEDDVTRFLLEAIPKLVLKR